MTNRLYSLILCIYGMIFGSIYGGIIGLCIGAILKAITLPKAYCQRKMFYRGKRKPIDMRC